MKRLITILTVLILAITFAACSKDSSNGTENNNASDKSFQVVVLTPESKITVDKDYTLSKMHTDILSDKAVADGWFYYYCEGTEPVASYKEWKCSDDKYTSMEVMFEMKTLLDQVDQTYLDRFTGYVIYNTDIGEVSDCSSSSEYLAAVKALAEGNEEGEIAAFIPLQRNPGQKDQDGYEIRSKDAVLLKKNEIAQIDAIADVSEKFLRSWEDQTAKEPLWAVFSLDEKNVYCVDLRTYLTDASEE